MSLFFVYVKLWNKNSMACKDLSISFVGKRLQRKSEELRAKSWERRSEGE